MDGSEEALVRVRRAPDTKPSDPKHLLDTIRRLLDAAE